MAINLFEAKYIPTIFLRNSELKAVEELPESTKDSLTPIFCLKPWATAATLDKAIAKIETVFGENRQYFLDIDPFYAVSEVKRDAQQQFIELVEADGAVGNWIDFLSAHPNASPCIQLNNASNEDILEQIVAFTKMERPFLVRLQHGGGAGENWSKVVEAVCTTDHSNFGFVVDLEWSNDLTTRIEWADRIVKQVVSLRGDSIPICVNGSSFPASFSKVTSGDTTPIFERLAYDSLVSNNNMARLVYGDWASSRPPSESIPIKHEIPPRIDLPTAENWTFFRIRSDDGGFQEAAKQALSAPSYPSGLDIWGTHMIESTAASPPAHKKDKSVIQHQSSAAAARINIHLFRQQFFDNFDPAPDTDDDFNE